MDVFDLTVPLPDSTRNAVVVIGNFDAVHRGHQSLLSIARRIADAKKRPLAVLTFEPHPRRLFRPDDAPFRVTPHDVKLDRLAACGVDVVYTMPFNWQVAEQPAQAFIDDVLKSQIGASSIVVGSDFHFGHNRTGKLDLLRANNLEVEAVDLLADKTHSVISATRIRGLIQSGHIDEANQLLGWDWEMRGVVQKGDQRGRELGYPTANIPLNDTIHPAYGIYATLVQVEGEGVWHKAATNIGIRPMFEVKTALIEAHILDFTGDLYGKTLRVRPVRKIRDEMKFDGLSSLVAQIERDCKTAQDILSAPTTSSAN